MQNKHSFQTGQILLVVVLTMVVALTIGLAVAARSITNSRTSTEEENSERAFSAAEAGIEESLQTNANSSGSFSNNSALYNTVKSNPRGLDIQLNNDTPILKDSPVDVWLSDLPDYSNRYVGYLTIYWGHLGETCNFIDNSPNNMPALEIVSIVGNPGNPTMNHTLVDPCGNRRSLSNKFSAPSAVGGGNVKTRTYAYRTTIQFSVPNSTGIVARIIPLYASTYIAVRGCDAAGGNCNPTGLNGQGTLVESTGTSDQTVRKVVSFKSNPSLPIEFFPYVLFCGGTTCN